MPPALVDSTQCHLWTDALHVRELARQASNRWDRGTYVRLTVVLCWTALEIACQDALGAPDIGYRFKENLDAAITARGLAALDWSQGVWQRVRQLQDLRKSYVHKFATLAEMFPEADVADRAVSVVREGIKTIYAHAGMQSPGWPDLDHGNGWSGDGGLSDSCTATLITAGTSLNDPTAVRIYLVRNGVEELSSVHPAGTDYAPEVIRLVQAVNVPINAVRVYEGTSLVRELLVSMRGN
jgi:hypothetical protein